MKTVPEEYKFYTNSKLMKQIAKLAHQKNEYVGQTSSLALSSLFKILNETSTNHMSKILDLGCGNGAFSIEIAKNFKCFVKGIDFSYDLITEAKMKANDQKLSDFCKFSVENLSELKETENSYFDILICIGSLYWGIDIDKALKSWSRKLKENQNSRLIIFSNLQYIELNNNEKEKIENTSFLSFNMFERILNKNGFTFEECIDSTAQYIRWLSRWCQAMKSLRSEIIQEMGELRAMKMQNRFQMYLKLAKQKKVKRMILKIRKAI